MSGAILSHVTTLGIEVKNDRGLFFGLALNVFVASLGILFLHRYEISNIRREVASTGRVSLQSAVPTLPSSYPQRFPPALNGNL